MKKTITILTVLFIMLSVSAQSPEKMSYQAVVRNIKGELIVNRTIGMKISILQETATGTVVYAETHTPQTNANGLVSIEVGAGTPITGKFSDIEWAKGPYFIKTEIDPEGGKTYSITATSQLLSVPYALYSKTTGDIPNNSVNSAKIADGTVGTADLATNSITSPKITDGTIATADIADGAVTIPKLPAGATATTYLRGDGIWATPEGGGTSQWITSGNNIYYNTGRVGIGIATPTAFLHIKGTGAGGGNLLAEGLFKEKQDAPPVTGAGTRMMWYSDKAAFRVGEVMGTNWDKDSIGNHSVAMGYDTRAKGIASTAIGNANKATGDYSLALGAVSVASGTRSVAIGAGNTASNNWSTAIGSYSTASGIQSTAFGFMNTAAGDKSMALGDNTTAYSMSETVLGSNNTAYTPLSKIAWNPADRLFVIGNGGNGVPRNAITVLKNGNIGIGSDTPKAILHVKGNENQNGNVLFEGVKVNTLGDPPASGEGTRMMWYADLAAFRAGYVQSIHWDKDSIGKYSTALGYSTVASGIYSTAMGQNTFASAECSTAMGRGTKALGWYSTAIGWWTQASGTASFASGLDTKALGGKSTAMGESTTAPSYCEVVIGKYNTEYTPISAGNWDVADRLFVVGNGTDEKKRSDALIILKNGNMTVGGDLRVEGNISSKGEKKTEVAVTVNTTINAGSTTSISFTFPKAYSAAPAVYVGNITTGGGFAEVIMSVAQVTTTGGKLFIFNPKSSSQSPNYTVKIIAQGAE